MNNSKYWSIIIGFLLILLSCIAHAQVPVIKEVSPKNGHTGQVINIKGENFESSSTVIFGAVQGSVNSVSNQLIEVEVSPGATYDNLSVLNPSSDLTGYSNDHFALSYGGQSGISNSDFDSQTDFFASDGLHDVCLCDLDGDLLNDIIGANSDDINITIFRNSSTPGAISMVKTNISLNATTLNTACGDLNGDGKPEVIFTEANDGNRVFVLVNNSNPGTLGFSLQTITISSVSTNKIAIRDLDLDGLPELIITDQSNNQVAVVKNTSSGNTLSFDSNIILLSVANAGSTAGLEVEDLNGDRRPEIIVNQFLTDGGGFYIAPNNSSAGNISFGDFEQFDTPGTFVNLKVGDLNGDDKADIAATQFLSATVSVFINETSAEGLPPTFSGPNNFPTDERPWGIDFADLDGDGDADIVVGTIGSDLSVNVLDNVGGSGSLEFEKVRIPVTFINRNIKSGDIDGDGKPDIVFASIDDENLGIPASNVSILRNNKCIIPVISPEDALTICSGNAQQLTTQPINGATYEWRQDGILQVSGPDNFFNVTTSGDYTVTILMESGACVEISQTVPIEVVGTGALPSPSISTNGPVCIGGSLELSADNASYTYQWSGPEGYSDTGQFVTHNDFTFSNTGRYYVDVYSGTCIIETQSIVVEAITAPDFFVSQSGSGVYCEDDLVTLMFTPNNGNYTYQWFDDSGMITGATSDNIIPTISGNYFIEATDQINATCPAVLSNSINIQIRELPQVDFELPASACLNAVVNFSNSSIIDNSATPEFNWTFGDGSASNEEHPLHMYLNSGQFDVTLEVSYLGLACTDQLTKQFTVNNNISIEILSDDTTICLGESIELSVSNTFDTYDWSTGESSDAILIENGNTYSVTVTDIFGCIGTDEIIIEEVPLPEVIISADKTNISTGEEVQLNASGLTIYRWSPGEYLNDSTISNPVALINRTTLYTLEGEDENGCGGSSFIEITVIEENIGDLLKPKNFFSPNDSDNINSLWVIDRIEDFPDCNVSIYDQTGNLIFNAQPYLNNWEGTKNGEKLPSGVYYFIIKCSNNEIIKSGSITLLR